MIFKLTDIQARSYVLVGLSLIVMAAVVLLLMGRVPICECGTVKLWHGDTMSSENSQHIADWYTPSHMIHGVLLYAVMWWFIPLQPLGARVCLAIFLEAAWEVFENTDFIINRYREATISLDYYGDSVINSVSDISFMLLGFMLAARLPVRMTIWAAVVAELVVGVIIKDNLTLNVLMLVYPIETVKAWQGG